MKYNCWPKLPKAIESKSGLVGFYDPCEESDKHLLIQYLYRGQIHQSQITDREQLRCPRMAHQLET